MSHNKNPEHKILINVSEALQLDIKGEKIVKIYPETSTMICEGMTESGVKTIGDDNDQKINKREFSWVRRGNNFFISAKPNTESIPSGLYDIHRSMDAGIYIEKRSVILDELYKVPEKNMGLIMDDIKKFWERQEKYKQYGITYKRGMLLYGPPGTGKTSLLNLVINDIINEHNGIALNMDDIDSFIAMAHNLRALEPEKPILAIIEDLDSFLQYNSTKQFLNLLDGNLQIDNVLYLATTNYLERLEDRIKNRPSRFDRRYEIGYPDAETRKFYLETKLKESDLASIDINKWVADTNGMSFSHLRELIVSVIIMDHPYQETINSLKAMYAVDEPTR